MMKYLLLITLSLVFLFAGTANAQRGVSRSTTRSFQRTGPAQLPARARLPATRPLPVPRPRPVVIPPRFPVVPRNNTFIIRNGRAFPVPFPIGGQTYSPTQSVVTQPQQQYDSSNEVVTQLREQIAALQQQVADLTAQLAEQKALNSK